jgi:hypothetical protein
MRRLSHISRALSKNPGSNILSWEGLTGPESAASFAAKFAEGAIGKSCRKEDIGDRPTGKVGGYPT